MTEVAGPYCINFTRRDEITVCGRYGKIIERFPLDAEADARALLRELMRGQPSPSARPGPRPNKMEAHVIANFQRRGGSQVLPGVGEPVQTAARKGFLSIETVEGGFRVTVTAAGMEASR